MRSAILRKAKESVAEIDTFFAAHAGSIEGCARAMAERLEAGGRLFSFGNGGSACYAQNIAVEFVHPIVEKRRPFAATVLTSDPATLTAIGNDRDFSCVFADQLRLFSHSRDIALGISISGRSRNVVRGLQVARERGLCTIALTGRDGGHLTEIAQHCFPVPCRSIHRIQEVHGVLLHVLWDLVHIALGEDDVI